MAVITNLTRGTVLATDAETARSFWARFVGLMGRSRLPPGSALIFPGEQGVHMFFMRFPIDVVFYDRDGVVIDVMETLRPWRLSRFHLRARGVVELPTGTVRASGTQRGDVLSIHLASPHDSGYPSDGAQV